MAAMMSSPSGCVALWANMCLTPHPVEEEERDDAVEEKVVARVGYFNWNCPGVVAHGLRTGSLRG